MNLERRHAPFKDMELRVVREGEGDDQVTYVEGTAVPYDSLSVDLGGFREKFEGGPADLDTFDVYAAPHHDQRQIIGRASAKTLELKDGKKGLTFRVKLPNTTAARDLVESIERGDIKGNSFTFSLMDADSERVENRKGDGEGEPSVLRTILRGKWHLHEVAPGVVTPAYEETDLSLARRSVEAHRKEQAADTIGPPRDYELEHKLREQALKL